MLRLELNRKPCVAGVVARHSTCENEPSGHIPFSDDSKKVFEHSLRESLALDHSYIGTEHMLLGLVSGPSARYSPHSASQATLSAKW